MEIVRKETVLGKEINIYGDFDNPLFLAKDVAEWIDYAKTKEGFYQVSAMLNTVDEDEKITINILNSEGKAHNAWFLTENGLYEVLMLSRKPIAKQFKKEVKRILRSVRKNGGYIAGQERLTDAEIIANALVVANRVIEEKSRLIAEQSDMIEMKDAAIGEMAPKAESYDEYIDRGKFCNLRDAANYLRVTQTELMDLLRSRYIYKNSVGEYRCYAEYAGYFALRPFGRGKDRTGHQLMVTVAGLTHFGRVLGEMHEERRKEIVDGGMEAAEKIIGSMRDGCPIQIGCISHRELAGAGRAENHTC